MRATHRLLELTTVGVLTSLFFTPVLSQTLQGPPGSALRPGTGQALGAAGQAVGGTVGQALGAAGQAFGGAAGSAETPTQPAGAMAAQPPMAAAERSTPSATTSMAKAGQPGDADRSYDADNAITDEPTYQSNGSLNQSTMGATRGQTPMAKAGQPVGATRRPYDADTPVAEEPTYQSNGSLNQSTMGATRGQTPTAKAGQPIGEVSPYGADTPTTGATDQMAGAYQAPMTSKMAKAGQPDVADEMAGANATPMAPQPLPGSAAGQALGAAGQALGGTAGQAFGAAGQALGAPGVQKPGVTTGNSWPPD
jgi:hypothetical protein